MQTLAVSARDGESFRFPEDLEDLASPIVRCSASPAAKQMILYRGTQSRVDVVIDEIRQLLQDSRATYHVLGNTLRLTQPNCLRGVSG